MISYGFKQNIKHKINSSKNKLFGHIVKYIDHKT